MLNRLLARTARRFAAPLLVALSLAATARAGDSFLPASAPFDATEMRIPMRDGAELAADVYLPRSEATAGPWPVVLIQTPYDKSGVRPWFQGEGRWGERSLFTDTAYAFVVTDWRGRSASAAAARPGRVVPGGADDGYDTVEWIATQPWSNGKIGTWGPSALGAAQFRTASARPPHLVCAVPVVMPLNLTYDIYFPGGALWEEFVADAHAGGRAQPECRAGTSTASSPPTRSRGLRSGGDSSRAITSDPNRSTCRCS